MILRPYSADTAALLASPPAPGENRHEWLFRVQLRLIRSGVAPEAVTRRLAAYCADVGWQDRLRELEPNAAKAISVLDAPPVSAEDRRPSWPAASHAERRSRFGADPMFDPLASVPAPPAEILRGLFATSANPDPWVCAARNIYRASTFRLSDLMPVAPRFEFIVANRMRQETGRTGTGRTSDRTKANAATEATRRWLVVEFDTGDSLPEQAAVLSSLHTPRAPLALVVWSGGKSLHGWFNVAGLTRHERRVWFSLPAFLGADVSLWDLAKLVRMPGGVRSSNGVQQRVAYWEPEHV